MLLKQLSVNALKKLVRIYSILPVERLLAIREEKLSDLPNLTKLQQEKERKYIKALNEVIRFKQKQVA